MLTIPVFLAWMRKSAALYAENKEMLTELDAAIGDADHGINISRGFAAVTKALEEKPPTTLADACKASAITLIKTVGGASGPLFGTFFMKMASTFGPGDSADFLAAAKAMEAGVEGIKKLGKGEAGEKTMLDALIPAVATLGETIGNGKSATEALHATVDAAETGMKATIPLKATKGRASYLGDRSIGHQDPGATSVWLLFTALAQSVN